MKALFFAPHAEFWVHAFPEALVAEALQQGTHDVVYVGCGRAFDKVCVPKTAHGLTSTSSMSDKQRVCDSCEARKDLLRRSFGFHGFDASARIESGDDAIIQGVLESVTSENLLALEFDGIEVGRYALYSLLIGRKKSSLRFSEPEWTELLAQVGMALRAAIVCRRILDEEKPDVVLVYNSLYPVNRVFFELARALEIPAYFIHAGGNLSNRLQTLIIGRGDWFRFAQDLIRYWRAHQDRPCRGGELSAVTNHFIELFRGQSVFAYSAAASRKVPDLRRHFGIEEGQRVLLATMSSYDELYAGQIVRAVPADIDPVFPSQIDWIQAMVEYARERPGLFLIIRVHPREFPNKREGEKSEHATALEAVFADLPDNVRVNWPADRLSLYDLAEEVDVVLNAWSSAGKEMALLGLPVVVYAPELLLYPAELNYVGTTVEEYFQRIEEALEAGWSDINIRRAYRWHALEFKTSLIDIGDSYGNSEIHGRPAWPARIGAAILRRVSPYHVERRDCARRAARLESADMINRIIESGAESVLDIDGHRGKSDTTRDEETDLLKKEIARLVRARYGDAIKPGNRSKLRSRLTDFSVSA